MKKQIPEFKVILIGDSNVGKTSLIVRATKDTYAGDGDTQNTIGFSFQKVLKKVFGKEIELFIWDTAGQEMYRSMIKMYYRGV